MPRRRKKRGGLSLETPQGWQAGGESGVAIVWGKPDESLLIEAINYRSLEMPPPDKGGKLPTDEIAILTKWVSDGAFDPRNTTPRIGGMDREQAMSWWAFQPLPHKSSLTPAIIDEHLAILQNDLKVAPAADKRTLIRRATYDLTGLPPTTEEVDAWMADASAAAFDKVIDRLLQSPEYGPHWGRHWLDVVRYADTAGENTDRPLPHSNNWDAHGDMMTHVGLANNVDRPIAALLKDLKQRGMLDDTLVVWTTEFGRTPFNNTADAKGREHHPWAFTSWLAGAGVKRGIVHGATDEHGLRAVEQPVHVHDFHATILHLMGFDHEQLTFRHAGRDYRLTDVEGDVVKGVLA